jgi:hypothetical protein
MHLDKNHIDLDRVNRSIQQQQQHNLLSQASWGRQTAVYNNNKKSG